MKIYFKAELLSLSVILESAVIYLVHISNKRKGASRIKHLAPHSSTKSPHVSSSIAHSHNLELQNRVHPNAPRAYPIQV